MSRLFVLVLGAMLVGGSAQAKPKGGTAPGKSVVKFDGDTIDGDLMRPDGDLMAGRPELPMPSLVLPPKSFANAQRQTILSAADAVAGHREQKISTGGR